MSWVATDHVRHNGVSYSPGKVIDDITDKQAAELVAAGVIEAAKAKPAAAKTAADTNKK